MLELKTLPRQSAPGREISWRIDELKALGRFSELAEMLPVENELYLNRNSGEVARLRGYILAAFQDSLPEEALIFVLDELQNSTNPYTLAAAAIAIRGWHNQEGSFIPYLLHAAANSLYRDDAVSFEAYLPQYPLENYTTPLLEVCKSLKLLGEFLPSYSKELNNFYYTNALILSTAVKVQFQELISMSEMAAGSKQDCCGLPVSGRQTNWLRSKMPKRLKSEEIILENQDSQKLPFTEFFSQEVSAFILFYSRCDNPNKCSLSVNRLAQLQALLANKGYANIRLAAITYDSAYDLPFRLKPYGENRGFKFDEKYAFFRVAEGYDAFSDYFLPEVNYTGSIVNSHSIELFIIDKDSRLLEKYGKLQWDPQAIAEMLIALSGKPASSINKKLRNSGYQVLNMLIGLIAFLFPKCPMCWAAYMSIFSAWGIQGIPYIPQLIYVFPVIMAINLYLQFTYGKRLNRMLPFFLNLVGIALIWAGFVLNYQFANYVGLFLVLTASLNTLSVFNVFKLKGKLSLRL